MRLKFVHQCFLESWNRIPEWFELEGALELILFHRCHGQEHFPLSQGPCLTWPGTLPRMEQPQLFGEICASWGWVCSISSLVKDQKCKISLRNLSPSVLCYTLDTSLKKGSAWLPPWTWDVKKWVNQGTNIVMEEKLMSTFAYWCHFIASQVTKILIFQPAIIFHIN